MTAEETVGSHHSDSNEEVSSSIFAERHAASRESRPKKPHRDWVDYTNLVVVILAFFAACAAACEADRLARLTKSMADDSRKNLIATNRAWIAPVSVALTSPLKSGEKIKYKLTYQNTGHQPAEEVVFQADDSDVRSAPIEKWDLASNPTDYIQQPTCVGLKRRQALHPGWPFIYPSSEPIYTVHFETAQKATIEMERGEAVQLVKGCFVYKTMGLTDRHSAYCFYLKPAPGRPMTDWRFQRCAFGNEGN